MNGILERPDDNLTIPSRILGDPTEALLWTVAGIIPTTQQRISRILTAPTARAAEDLVIAEITAQGVPWWGTGVFAGGHEPADPYAAYVDPDRLVEGLPLAVPGCELADYTVTALIRDPADEQWNQRHGGQRYLVHTQASDPRQAEDFAQLEASEEHTPGVLWVARVFHGHIPRADADAQFADPYMVEAG